MSEASNTAPIAELGDALADELYSAVAQALYEQSDDFDPAMPQLWQRGFMTREPIREQAYKLVRRVVELGGF